MCPSIQIVFYIIQMCILLEDMSGQAIVGQAVPGTLASGNGNDNTDSQVVLGVANVHVDSVLL